MEERTDIREVLFPNAVLLPEVTRMVDEGHSVTIRLRGYSMRPFLENDRDKALLRKAGDIKVGDPVLAEIAKGKYVLHRIVKIDGDDVTLLGDGNLRTEACKTDDIRAAVVGFYRKGRKTPDLVNSRKWKTYSFVWMRLRPVRRYLLAFYRRIWIPLFGTI